MSTPNLRRCGRRPRPRQSGQGRSGICPRPPQLRHGIVRTSCPSGERTTWRTWPAPSHSLQVRTSAPSAAPSPSQTSQVRDQLEIEVDVRAAGRLGEIDVDRGLRVGAGLGAGRAAKPPPKSEPSRSSRNPMSMKRSVWKPCPATPSCP